MPEHAPLTATGSVPTEARTTSRQTKFSLAANYDPELVPQLANYPVQYQERTGEDPSQRSGLRLPHRKQRWRTPAKSSSHPSVSPVAPISPHVPARLATALPPAAFTQAECWDIAQRSEARRRLSRRSLLTLRAILRHDSGISTRHFAMPDIERVFSLTPDELNEAFRVEAPRRPADLAHHCARRRTRCVGCHRATLRRLRPRRQPQGAARVRQHEQPLGAVRLGAGLARRVAR